MCFLLSDGLMQRFWCKRSFVFAAKSAIVEVLCCLDTLAVDFSIRCSEQTAVLAVDTVAWTSAGTADHQ